MTTAAAPEKPHDLGLLTLSLWFGILGGLGEVAVHVVRRFVRHRFIFISDESVWIAPLMVALLLLLIGAALVGIQRLRGKSTNALLVPAFLFITSVGVLLSYPRLHWVASLVIALGVAFQGSRWFRRRSETMARFIGRTLPFLLGLVVLLAGGLLLARKLTREASGPAPAAGTPNVLLVILDTVRELDIDGGDGFRHYFPKLFRRSATGVRFTRAFSSSPWTLPSHATMFTGRWPEEHQANWDTPLDGTYPTLAEAMAEAGYVTAGFVANKVYATRASGLSRGFQVYHDFLMTPSEMVRSSTLLRMATDNRHIRRLIGSWQPLARKDGDQINQEFLAWERNHGSRPFFVFLNYFDAHSPYLPIPPYDSALVTRVGEDGDRMRWFDADYVNKLPKPDVIGEMFAAYAGELEYLDDRVDALLDSLDRRDQLKNTWIILTADHGEEFGEHGELGHGHNLYRTSTQVPLVLWGPGITPGISAAPVSLRNIPATVMRWVRPQAASRFPGTSLLDLMVTGDSARSDIIYVGGMSAEYSAGGGDMFSWRQDSVRVIKHFRTGDEVHSLNDPLEQK
jgi:arylsulfatase A-like enzyme